MGDAPAPRVVCEPDTELEHFANDVATALREHLCAKGITIGDDLHYIVIVTRGLGKGASVEHCAATTLRDPTDLAFVLYKNMEAMLHPRAVEALMAMLREGKEPS